MRLVSPTMNAGIRGMASREHVEEEQPSGPPGSTGSTRDQTRDDADLRDAAGNDDDSTAPPRTIGRFVVLRRVGHGSMGEVYSAFDEELGRRVAIKLLRQPRPRGSQRARMRREAQAMAKVSHPNVIQVFEVGEHLQRTFIAMEYVEGQTLERWQRGTQGKPRSREEILHAYLAAGAGLAAAHRAGVLHRDFKPSNVLVDADGGVHVMDFGLAAWLRPGDSSASGERSQLPDEGERPSDAVDGPRLTRAGVLVGTPAFMSPEQYRREELDARSDQFSFCVALWEALVGLHPFGGGSVDTLGKAILAGEVREGAATRTLPVALRRTLVRGLAKLPQARWPDMDALLAALRPQPRRARWPWVVAAASILAVAGVSYDVARRRTGLCEGGPEQLARVWNDERRAAAEAGLLRTGAFLAEPAWRRIEPELDAHATAWVAARERVCEATHVRGEQSPELMDRRMACLELRLDAMNELLDTFEQADHETVLRAVDASARLPRLASCESVELGERSDAEAARPEAVALRRRLANAKALLDVERNADAYARLEQILAEAREHDLPRLAAEALGYRGRAELGLGRLEDADVTLEAAVWAAVARGHDEAAFRAAIDHVQLVGVTLGDGERGRAGIARSGALLLRLGEPEESKLAYMAKSGLVLSRHGDQHEAKQRLDEALALARQLHGTEHVGYASTLNDAGVVAVWGADFEAAKQRFGELIELDRRLYDPGHPRVASALSNLAAVMSQAGDLDGAQQRFQEVLEIRRRVHGEHHVDVGDALLNLAVIAAKRDQPVEALALTEQARTSYAASMGDDAAKLAEVDLLRGSMLISLDRAAEAESVLRDVLARQRKLLGERHPELAYTLDALGHLLTRPESAAEAVELFRTAIELRQELLRESGVAPDQDSFLQITREHLADAERMLREGPSPPSPPRR